MQHAPNLHRCMQQAANLTLCMQYAEHAVCSKAKPLYATKLNLCLQAAARDEHAARDQSRQMPGTQFTGFTSTHVQILTPEALLMPALWPLGPR